MSSFDYTGKTALVTGASAGIGVEFAQQLAARGCTVVLVARRKDRLDELASKLLEGNMKAFVCEADLSKVEAVKEIRSFVDANNLKVDILVNNAGFGTYGPFLEQNAERELEEVAVNITAVVALCHEFIPLMAKRGHGAVINVASVAGFQPLGFMAVYAATKAFVLSFSEALWAELTPHRIRVLAVCPGPVQTEFFKIAGSRAKGAVETPSHCVQMALHALDKKRSFVVTGGIANSVLTEVSRFTSRGVAARAGALALKPKR
ncbi:MAG: SDR family oxidoreductase [Candidatus Obscuribacterales bacterium]|nr:SDR family oxidoreductase [Candidatus Obscuribacterales bacterium]